MQNEAAKEQDRIPQIIFREIFSDEENNYRGRSAENQANMSHLSEIKKSNNQDSIDYSRDNIRHSRLKDHSRSISYSDRDRILEDEEDFFAEDSLAYIEDEKKREEILAYRQKKREAIEEERRIDGNTIVMKNTDRS